MKSYKLYIASVLLFIAGCFVNLLGDRLLGVHFELFFGLTDFNLMWIVDLFLLPALVGYAVAVVYGFGGKWLAFMIPLVAHLYAYYQFSVLADMGQLPAGAQLQPMAWWGFYVIVAMEAALIGGVFGEALVKKTYGRRPRDAVFKSKTPPSP